MRAAEAFDGGAQVDVMSVPMVTDVQIAQMRGRMMASLRLQGWSYAAIGKMFRCSDRWVRVEIAELPQNERRGIGRRFNEDRPDDEDEEISMAV